jgi:endonuclease III
MKTDIDSIYKILNKTVKGYQVPIVDLIEARTKDPFKILVATILSARTNDKTTSVVCKRLFAKVNSAKDLEKLTVKQIEKLIYPVGFYRNKANHLKKLPVVLKEKFMGKIPKTIEELIELPGVGRKTANLVMAVAFKIPAICVDVHVNRIMNRFGYIKTKNPLETEMVLRKKLPKKYWLKINYVIVAFGQNLCKPINPRCDICPVYKYCNRVGVKTKYGK